MSSWRPGDAPRGRRDYRDGPPPQRYDDRRGRSRSRDRGPPPGRYDDRGPPRGGPGYGYQGRGGYAPPGGRGGGMMQVQNGTRMLTVQIPPGLVPGAVFQVQVSGRARGWAGGCGM